LCATALAALSAQAIGAAPPVQRPDIIYINIDDLGWADLGCYGNKFCRTPTLDRLATQGMRFTHAYAPPCCTPSRVALVTGQHPARLHMTGQPSFYQDPPIRKLLHPHFNLELPADAPTIARTLSSGGYRCFSFGKWGIGQRTAGHGFERVQDMNNEKLTDTTVGLITSPHTAPYFLYLNYHWIHSPLHPDPALAASYRERFKAAGVSFNPDYAAIVEQIDRQVARIVDAIDQAKAAPNTLLIFTSDNGGFLGTDDEPYTSNAPLNEGKSSLYEGGIRVPLIVRWPGVVPAGTVCESPVNKLDWHPTFAALLGLSLPRGAVLDGLDISPLLRGAARAKPRDLFWHFPHYRRAMATIKASPASAVRHGDWKLIHFYEDDHVELYNLSDDPGEQHDLAKTQPAKTAELRHLLDAWRTAVDAQPPLSNPLYKFRGF
jgi:uncharacterized sulfatase